MECQPRQARTALSFLHTSRAVSPASLVFNIVDIRSGVYRFIREGRINWPVAAATILPTLTGALSRFSAFRLLGSPRQSPG